MDRRKHLQWIDDDRDAGRCRKIRRHLGQCHCAARPHCRHTSILHRKCNIQFIYTYTCIIFTSNSTKTSPRIQYARVTKKKCSVYNTHKTPIPFLHRGSPLPTNHAPNNESELHVYMYVNKVLKSETAKDKALFTSYKL